MMSVLRSHFLEPRLCQSLPGKPTCMTYDNVHKQIAIGCEQGQLVILTNQREIKRIRHDEAKPVKLMAFSTHTKEEDKSYLATSLSNHPFVYLWTMKDLCLQQKLCLLEQEIPSVLVWSSIDSRLCYIGTKTGNVQNLVVSEDLSPKLHEFIRKEQSLQADSEVAVILEKMKHQLLVFFTKGEYFLWSGTSQAACGTLSNEEPIAAWFPSNSRTDKNIAVACKSGQLHIINIGETSGPKKTPNEKVLYRADSSDKPIQKVKHLWVESSMWIVYCQSHTLYIQIRHGKEVSNYHRDFQSNVIDFIPLLQKIQSGSATKAAENELLLAILTEHDLVFLRKNTRTSGTQTRYIPFRGTQRHTYPYITAPVTCLQHCGLCTKEFLERFPTYNQASQTQGNITQELAFTGHSDGSFRFWAYCLDTSHALSFEPVLVMYTTYYFEYSLEQLKENKQQVKLMKLDCNQRTLLIADKCNHVMLFDLLHKRPENAKPQSQEVILKEQLESTSAPLKMPLPHLKSKTPSRLQQHFSCYYQGKDKKVHSVQVNCMDYVEKLEMLAVGTSKGLIILDTKKNMLVQVFGSDSKLLKMCSLDASGKSSDECVVTCLETAETFVKEQDGQISSVLKPTLWVGTASGSVGALSISRDGDGTLQLGRTGRWRQGDGEVVIGIHFISITKKLSEDQQTISFTESRHRLVDVDVLVSTKKGLTKLEDDCVYKDSIIKCGLIAMQDQKHSDSGSDQPLSFVCLNKTGKFVMFLLSSPHGKAETTEKISAQTMFSSSDCSSYAIIKRDDDTGPQFVYFKKTKKT